MNKTLAILSLLIIISTDLLSQTKAITEHGDTIIVFGNGTWQSLDMKPAILIPSIGAVNVTIGTDKKTELKSITTENWDYFGNDEKKKSISGSISKVGKSYQISIIYAGDLGCLAKEKSTLKIKLSTGLIIECIQISKSDCASIQKAKFVPISLELSKRSDFEAIIRDNIELLATYDWEMMRIQGTHYYADIYPYQTKKNKHPEQFFRQHLSAIARQ